MNAQTVGAALRILVKACALTAALYATYLFVWFVLIAACVTTQPEWQRCGETL